MSDAEPQAHVGEALEALSIDETKSPADAAAEADVPSSAPIPKEGNMKVMENGRAGAYGHLGDAGNVQEDSRFFTALGNALANVRERGMVLKLIHLVEDFVETDQDQLEFPAPLSSFQRMLAHKMAQHYGMLTHLKKTAQHGIVVAVRTARTGMRETPEEKEHAYNQAREKIMGGSHMGAPNQTMPADRSGRRNSRGLGHAGDPSGRAVFRNRVRDAQDPDYVRGVGRYRPRFHAGFGEGESGIYSVSSYGEQFPALAAVQAPGIAMEQGWTAGFSQGQPPPPPPPHRRSYAGAEPVGFTPGAFNPVPYTGIVAGGPVPYPMLRPVMQPMSPGPVHAIPPGSPAYRQLYQHQGMPQPGAYGGPGAAAYSMPAAMHMQDGTFVVPAAYPVYQGAVMVGPMPAGATPVSTQLTSAARMGGLQHGGKAGIPAMAPLAAFPVPMAHSPVHMHTMNSMLHSRADGGSGAATVWAAEASPVPLQASTVHVQELEPHISPAEAAGSGSEPSSGPRAATKPAPPDRGGRQHLTPPPPPQQQGGSTKDVQAAPPPCAAPAAAASHTYGGQTPEAASASAPSAAAPATPSAEEAAPELPAANPE